MDDQGGGGSQGEKQSMGPAKRGRSSLDYKVRTRSTEPITTTKPGKRKNSRQALEEQKARETAAAAAQLDARMPIKSRARGSSGPPPRKFELSDLDGMSEAQILEALYADPDLAQSVAKMAEQMSTDGKSPPPGAPAGARKNRRSPLGSKKARKEFSEYPDHMRELMDGGVPVMQWVILLALLGLALYQLRKILTLPDTKDQNKGRGQRVKGSGKKGAKKDLGAVEDTLRAIDIDTLEPAVVKQGASSKSPKKGAPAAKKKKKGKVNAGTPSKKQQKEMLSANETTGANEPVKEVDTTAPFTAPIQSAAASAADDDGAGWQTVSKSSAPAPPVSKDSEASNGNSAPSNSKASNGNSAPSNSKSSEGKPKAAPSAEEAPLAVHGKKENTPPAMNGSTAGKKKKKKKAKAGTSEEQPSSKSPAAGTIPKDKPEAKATDGDEVLAKKLQREEETVATSAAKGSAETDVWEEVTARKRKGTKQEDAAA